MSSARERTLPQSTLFRRTERGIPEVEAQRASTGRNGSKPKRQRIKATFYLEPEDVLAIDHLQTEAFRETGKKPERSELVSLAIQEYIKNHANGTSN